LAFKLAKPCADSSARVKVRVKNEYQYLKRVIKYNLNITYLSSDIKRNNGKARQR